MSSQESISFSMDSTTESIDETTTKPRDMITPIKSNLIQSQQNEFVLFQTDDSIKSAPDRLMIVANEQTPPSTSTPDTSPETHKHNCTTNEHANVANCVQKTRMKRRKTVLFDTVTVYHFNRSQGFTTVPSQGGSTLGMRRKHFLRRRLSVDLYEEVRRRSRREILLKIRLEKRKQEERLRRELMEKDCDDGSKDSSSNSSSSPSMCSNTNTSDDDDDSSYSDYSDISDSELESDGYIFLQPIGVRLRRSLLRASGVGRIDPSEKKECNIIRGSRERAGCKCVGQCKPNYCECARLGVNCHVDRISFPCGCVSSGCQNPLGRTEFDIARVRCHFDETLLKTRSPLEISESDPSNSDLSSEVPIEYEIGDEPRLELSKSVRFNPGTQGNLDYQTQDAKQSSSVKTF